MAMAMASPNNIGYEWKRELPIGFKFAPTDEELYTYLRVKSRNGQILPGIINELDIYQYEPHQLSRIAVKHWDGHMYFFTPVRLLSATGTRNNRTIVSQKGSWKATQAQKNRTKDGTVIGTKTPLTYHDRSSGKTSWLMNEYRIPVNQSPTVLFNGIKQELTLCEIYKHVKKGDDKVEKSTQPADPTPLEDLQNPSHNLSCDHNLESSTYTFPITNNPNSDNTPQEISNSYSNVVSNCVSNSFSNVASINWVPLQQYQPDDQLIYPVNATTSTMHARFHQLPYGQSYDVQGFDPSFNLHNKAYCMGEGIGPIPEWQMTRNCNNSSASQDQKNLETCQPNSQGQSSSSCRQDQPLQKKRRINILN